MSKEIDEFREEMLSWFETVTENQQIILDNQAEILEKLDNLSRPGGDYSIDSDE